MTVNVIGAGLTGATIARVLKDGGRDVVIWEKADRVGGMCADEWQDGLLYNLYGGHVLHSDDDEVWEFFSRFAAIEPYRHRVLASVGGRVFQFPLNTLSLMQVYGVDNVIDLLRAWSADRVPCADPQTVEQAALAMVGRRIYEDFYEGYTAKQWGMTGAALPAYLMKRIPLYTDYTWDYFSATRSGVPKNGYSRMIEAMIGEIPVELNAPKTRDSVGRGLWICTAPLDEFYGYRYGKLPYRSLRHVHAWFNQPRYFGVATMNYPDSCVPYTRAIEWKWFHPEVASDRTMVTFEYPETWQEGENERFYPIPLKLNRVQYSRYEEDAKRDGIIPAGRLGTYEYLDMDTAVRRAMDLARSLL